MGSGIHRLKQGAPMWLGGSGDSVSGDTGKVGEQLVLKVHLAILVPVVRVGGARGIL